MEGAGAEPSLGGAAAAGAQPTEPLQEVVEAWLAGLPEGTLLPQEGGLLRLEVEILELAASRAHPQLLEVLLEAPERVRQTVLAALTTANLLAPGQRVWLRPRQLPAPFQLGVPDAVQALRCAPGALLAVHGVVTAATALLQQPVSRAFECAVCARVCTLHGAGAPPPCCGGTLREVEQARVMVPAQVIFLAEDVPLASAPSTQLGGSTMVVHLADDLAGRAHIGDRVLATGSGRFYGGAAGLMAPGAHLPLTLGIQLEACNLEVLRPQGPPQHPFELGAAAQPHLTALAAAARSQDGSASLEAALQVLDAALPVAASPLLKVAVLLSAAAAGTGGTPVEAVDPLAAAEDPEPQALVLRRQAGAGCSRNQVNIMLTAAAPEPHLQRFLRAAAATLCDHSVAASSADPKRLVPRLDQKFVAPVLGVAAPLAIGGQLAEAAPGVLLLSSSCLDTRRAIALGQYVAAGEAALQPGCPELCVPVETTLWTMVHEQDLSKSGRCIAAGAGASAGADAPGGLSLTERIINRFSHPFFSQHDILVVAGPETEDEVDLMVDAILGARSAPSVGDAGALRALQHHLAAARAAPQPALSAGATALLSAYFLHLRALEGAQQSALASLVRVAAASARLRRSAEVAAVPDAALAVVFLEEKLLAAGRSPAFWPRWRAELQHCTPLGECMRGLAEDVAAELGIGASGCCGSGWDAGLWGPEE
ncbi:hypothetical protein ABPG75_005708 [Micractinium tetrahymenae]